ncbi:MAG: MlaD family protein [Chitinophagaceae bacterium]|nr:MlaD family protein [Chitinophagaceae bacterium]
MKISNETKIGVLTAIAITILILGFNFLKGKSLFEKKDSIYAVFDKVSGLSTSNPVHINGYQVGSVSDIEAKDADLTGVIVTIHITKDVNIPDNSFAVINSNPLGTTIIDIKKGTSAKFLKDGDTVSTNPSSGLLDELRGSLNPAVDKVNGTLKSLDSLLEVVGAVFDPKTKNNMQVIIANLASSTASLNALLNTQTGALAKTMGNLNAFTANLKQNNDTIDQILGNVEKMTSKFANLPLDQTLTKLQATADNLNTTLSKINKGDGTLGLLMNDKKLYNNLAATSNSLNILLQDFRLHPKRYISFSVFGKKDKTGPLMQPLEDSVKKAPNQ